MVTSTCILGIIPGRAEPSHKSEMTSQLLFGEEFEIIEKHEEWVFIKSLIDDYTFWIEDKQSSLSFQNSSPSKNNKLYEYSKDILSNVKITNQFIQNLITPFGSILHKIGDKYEINGEQFTFEGQTHIPSKNKNDLITFAHKFLNTPYLWGGKTPFGIDCSGFVQICFRMIGIDLPRDAHLQENYGKVVNLNESQLGDLAFFENNKGKITHVGIILENNEIIHSSGHVKIEPLDQKGIYSPQLQKHTHKLCSIKSLI